MDLRIGQIQGKKCQGRTNQQTMCLLSLSEWFGGQPQGEWKWYIYHWKDDVDIHSGLNLAFKRSFQLREIPGSHFAAFKCGIRCPPSNKKKWQQKINKGPWKRNKLREWVTVNLFCLILHFRVFPRIDFGEPPPLKKITVFLGVTKVGQICPTYEPHRPLEKVTFFRPLVGVVLGIWKL